MSPATSWCPFYVYLFIFNPARVRLLLFFLLLLITHRMKGQSHGFVGLCKVPIEHEDSSFCHFVGCTFSLFSISLRSHYYYFWGLNIPHHTSASPSSAWCFETRLCPFIGPLLPCFSRFIFYYMESVKSTQSVRLLDLNLMSSR